MRVTNSMMVSQYLTNLNSLSSKQNKLMQQATLGRKYLNTSDDPVNAMKARRARAQLDKLETYKSNVNTATGYLTETETVLMEMNDIMQRVKDLTNQAATGTLSDDDRANIGVEIEELKQELLDCLNAKFGDKYLFGGYNVNNPPFTIDENTGELCYNGEVVDMSNQTALDDMLEDIRSLQVGDSTEMELAINGLRLILMGGDDYDNNLFSLLDNLAADLEAGASAEDISQNYLDQVTDAHTFVTTMIAEVGAKTNRLEMLTSRYEQDELNYTQVLSDAEDVEYEDIIMEWMTAYSMYSAALSAGSYVIQNSLMDFLR